MMHTAEAGLRGNFVLPAEERRRSQRVVIRVPVRLHFAATPPPPPLSAFSLVVNNHGAMLLCDRSFNAGAKFDIENARSSQRVTCRVTRSPRHSGEGFLVPVEFVQPVLDFWGISFPPTDWKPIND